MILSTDRPDGCGEVAMYGDRRWLEVVDRRIEAFEEAWLPEHKIAELCHKFEVSLGKFVELFQLVKGFEDSWRDDVFRGECKYCPEINEGFKTTFEKWLGYDSLIQDLLGFFESQGYPGGVNGATEYRDSLRIAKETLAEWEAPELSSAIAVHTVKLNEEQSRAFRKLLAR